MFFNLFKKQTQKIKNPEQELSLGLEQAKQKLISDLENNGVRNLVKKMDCNKPYSPLIKEKQLQGSYGSGDDVSWYAYEVSSKLSKYQDKQELLDMLKESEYKPYRKYIFCCLASLCSNTNDLGLLDFLLKQIESDDDESTIVSVLSRLSEISKPSTTDISIIKKHLQEGTENTRRAAIKALSNSKDDEVEDLLLAEFKISDRHTKGMICTPLYSVGTRKAIPILQAAYKQTREPFLRAVIERTIAEINKRE